MFVQFTCKTLRKLFLCYYKLSPETEEICYKSFADDAIEASDGTIYFSDASSKFGFHNWHLDLLEARPNGRLLKYDPLEKKTTVVLANLTFPNGVALSPNEDYLLVCESWKYAVEVHIFVLGRNKR